RHDIHGLNPDKRAVTPVAPLRGRHQLSDGLAVDLGEVVTPEAPIGEDCLHAGLEQPEVQSLSFGLGRQRGIGSGYERQVSRRRLAYLHDSKRYTKAQAGREGRWLLAC